MKSVRISRSAFEALQAHLLRSYPNEGCGVFIGKKLEEASIEILRAAGTRNAEKIRGHDRFSIEPLDYLKIERELDDATERLMIVGFFHSHPDALAIPSATDLDMAQGLFDVTQEYHVYAITSVFNHVVRDTTYWRLSENATHFEALNAVVGE